MPLITSLVVCGLKETMDTLLPTRLFTKVDLPTLGLPTTQTNPDLLPLTFSSEDL